MIDESGFCGQRLELGLQSRIDTYTGRGGEKARGGGYATEPYYIQNRFASSAKMEDERVTR